MRRRAPPCAGACDGTLTGADACAYPAGDTSCGERRCDSAMLIDLGACDGADPPALLCDHGCAVAARNGANGANTPLALLALALAALTVVVIARIPRARRRRA
ncbi:MAG: hypothetical protein EXR73_06650 [Myxococcales bacterium]|nr:hypothetical protein [Myxococcales bacterium]